MTRSKKKWIVPFVVAAIFVEIAVSSISAQEEYYSEPISRGFPTAPGFPSTFSQGELPISQNAFVVPPGGSEIPGFSGNFESADFLGSLPPNFDINSVPLLEQAQPNAPRKLPPLQVPQTADELTARFSALKKRFSNPPLSIERSTPGRLLRYSLVAGADATFLASNPTTAQNAKPDAPLASSEQELKPIFALGAPCWNVPCAGRRLFRVADGRPIPAVGFGFQTKRGELLAALAFARVDRNYEIRVDDYIFTVQDLVDWEKRACSNGADLSLVAVGLAHYSQNADETWTNASGEVWSLFRLLESETTRPVDWASTESTDKLMGLTYLLARLKQGRNADAPELKRTESFLVALKSRIWEIFDGAALGESLFFDARTKVSTPFMKLYVDGALFRWLASTASPDEIRSEKTARAAAELCALVDRLFNSVDDLDKLSPTDEESLGVAMQALSIYQKRINR